MTCAVSHDHYSSLSLEPGDIRLLRVLPDKDEAAPIRCQLSNYSLHESTKGTHLYEALSYVWGNPKKVLSIFLADRPFDVTENLHAALLRLRDRSFERVIWVDAICINQEDNSEKEHQILSMAKIYSQANRVIVWLGEAEDNSDEALKALRAAGMNENVLCNPTIQQAILQLLERPWFRRVWVRQRTFE